MRAAVLYDVDDIRIEARPVPEIGDGDVLVRVAASGICSGDLMPWYVRRKAPLVFGHEIAGTIVTAGSAARDRGGAAFVAGERVAVHHHAPCFACAACARGDYVQCATWRATALDPGGMAEFVRVPQANLADTLRVPPALAAVDASLVEPLGCVVKSLRRAFPARDALAPGGLSGATLYAIGLGVMGLLHVALARAAGARVVASDFVAQRRAIALELGAEAAFDPADADRELAAHFGDGPDVAVCGPGSAAALDHAIARVRAGGTVVMFTPLAPGAPYAFDQSAAYFRDLRLVASYSCGPDDTRDALAALERGAVDAARLHATIVEPGEVPDAYRRMRSAEIVKAIVAWDR